MGLTKYDPRVWLSIDLDLGSTSLPVRVAIRVDGLVELTVGAENTQGEYFTALDADELGHVIQMLQIAHDAAAMPLGDVIDV